MNQSAEGTSLASQEAACRAHAESLGYAVGPIYTDVHSGADLFGREGMSALLHAIKAREVGIVIAHALDRLSRSQIHFGLIFSEALHAGVPIELVSEKLDDSPVGRFVMAAQSFSAEIEREKIRERSVRGKKTRIQSGKIHGFGADLFGYVRDKEAGKRTIVDDEAATVRRVFDAIAVEGMSVRGLARLLNEDGVPSPSKGRRTYKDGRTCKWNPSSLYRMLREPAYKGDTILWRRQSRGSGKMWQYRDESEWIHLPEGTTPPIVSVETWDMVQARLEASTATSTRNAFRPYLLRGMIYCSVCGCRMSPQPEHGRMVYRCTSRDRLGSPCGGKRVPGADVEAWAWSEIEAILRNPSTIIKEVERLRTAGPDETLTATRETAARMLAKLERQRERLVRRYADADDDSFPWELVEREITRVESERRNAAAGLADIDARLAEQERSITELDDLRAYVDRVGANLDAADFDTKRSAVEALVERIDANGREWNLTGSIPLRANAGVVSISSSGCARQQRPLPARASHAPAHEPRRNPSRACPRLPRRCDTRRSSPLLARLP
jgi:site-specific DNA recombinase